MKVTSFIISTAFAIASVQARLSGKEESIVVLKNVEEMKTVELIPVLTINNPNGGHYSDPFQRGCAADEHPVQVQGIGGAMCAPTCNGFSCPTDAPDGVDAKPQCVLQEAASGKRYCALVCNANSNCGKNASCKNLGPVGICTYDS